MAVEYDLQVNGVTLEGSPASSASCYLLQRVEGLDSREMREQIDANAGEHGDVTSSQKRSGIRLIVSGVIIASSVSDLRTKDAALRAALAGGEGAFAVSIIGRTGDPATLAGSFYVSSPYRAADDVEEARLIKRFAFGVRSDSDVWTTGTVNASASTAAATTRTVTNAGDVAVYPTIELTATGTATIDYIENVTTGEILQLDALPVSSSASPYIFDFAAGTISHATAGNLIGYLNAAAEWFKLQPGSNGIKFVLASGTAVTMVVKWEDPYL